MYITRKGIAMKKGIKCRIYPNKEQIVFINKTLGCCRLVYNKGLAMRKEACLNGEKKHYEDTAKMVTALKQDEDYEFLNEVDSVALQQTLRDLNQGYINFFEHRTGYPVFKKKHDNHQSYRTLNRDNNIRITGKYIRLPKLGYVRIKQGMPIENIKNVTIERTPSGKYFAVIQVDFVPEVRPNNGGEIGLDMGIKDFYVDSNGGVVENPKYLEKSEKKIRKEQRRLSRKVVGSNNRNKQRIRVAKVHEKIANCRNDFLQKQSTMLVRENQTICIEDLKVKNMIKNRKLAKHIASVSWSSFFDMLEYKAQWYGSEIIRIPSNYPSSQTCSVCGYKNAEVKNLSVRNWVCPECGVTHNRDANAAINILNKGLEIKKA